MQIDTYVLKECIYSVISLKCTLQYIVTSQNLDVAFLWSTNSSLPSQQPSQGDFQILECGETKRIVEVYFDCRYYIFCAFRHFLQAEFARRWQSHTENPSRESRSVASRLRYVIISKVNFAKQELTTGKQRLRWFGRRQAADSSFKTRWRLNQQTIGPNDAGDVATDLSLRWS